MSENNFDIQKELKSFIRDVPDFPKKGVLFKDITTLLKEPRALRLAIDAMATPFLKSKIDQVVGVESRGFIFSPAIAYRLDAGFIPVRKPGKLPAETDSMAYELEYGKDSLEIHKDAIAEGSRVLVVDDLLATGGTAKATKDLVERSGGQVIGFSFLIELESLKGNEKLGGIPIHSLVKY